jgi:hypothetical protein
VYSYKVPYIGGSFFDGDYKRRSWGNNLIYCDGNNSLIIEFSLSGEYNNNILGLMVLFVGFIVAAIALAMVGKEQYKYTFNYLM